MNAKKSYHSTQLTSRLKAIPLTVLFGFFFCNLNAQSRPASEAAGATSVTQEGGAGATAKKQNYDLSGLPDDLRVKVEKYLKEEAKLEKEVKRMDAMVKAASNSWAQQRATGMATKLNYELRQQRVLRREIIRDYRKLLKSGWQPPKSMDFEKLLVNPSGSKTKDTGKD